MSTVLPNTGLSSALLVWGLQTPSHPDSGPLSWPTLLRGPVHCLLWTVLSQFLVGSPRTGVGFIFCCVLNPQAVPRIERALRVVKEGIAGWL